MARPEKQETAHGRGLPPSLRMHFGGKWDFWLDLPDASRVGGKETK